MSTESTKRSGLRRGRAMGVAGVTALAGLHAGGVAPASPAEAQPAALGRPEVGTPIPRVTSSPRATTEWAKAWGWGAARRGQGSMPATASSACDNDAQNRSKATIVEYPGNGTWYTHGTIVLQYSPTCRKVRAIASRENWPCSGSWDIPCIRATICHQHTDDTFPSCDHVHSGGRGAWGLAKSVTPWINDVNICQFALGEVWYGNIVSDSSVSATECY